MKNQELIKLGAHTSYLDYGDNDRPCIGYVQGRDGSLVVDGGNSPGNARVLLDKLSEDEKRKISAVLITHWHWDHVFGADTFGVKVVGFPKLKNQLEAMSEIDWSLAGLKQRHDEGSMSDFSYLNQTNEIAIGGRGGIPKLAEIVDRREFDLGGVNCIYEEIPSPHVDGSYVVLVPEDKVLFMGDCLWPDMEDPKNWHYDIDKVRALYYALKDYDAEWFVDSHADPIDRRTLFLWLDRLLRLLDAAAGGQSYKDALDSLPEKLKAVDIGYNDVIESAFG